MVAEDKLESIQCDVAIVGGGICGCALAYVLHEFTNVGSIALVEKCDKPAEINSAEWNNSQTLHFGDIETNYDLEKSRVVKNAAGKVARYLEQFDADKKIHTRYHKMVLGVGEEECERLKKRFEAYREEFPDLELIEREKISELEPNVIKGRDPDVPVMALYTENGITVDYGALADSFLEQIRTSSKESTHADLFFGRKVERILPLKDGHDGYTLQLDDGRSIKTRFLAVTAGGHSLLFAKKLGYGQQYGLLSVAGSFYHASKQLNGKVYTLQIKELPFAAPHGDPEVHDANKTRFGPTAKPLPLIERHHYDTLGDYFRTLGFGWGIVASLLRILFRPVILRFAVLNSLYEVPWLGKRLFLKKIRKIVPGLRPEDISRARGYGGVRPQIVDTEKRDLDMGEAKIKGRNSRFVITPSPGASVCLQSAMEDAQAAVESVGGDFSFDKDRFNKLFQEN